MKLDPDKLEKGKRIGEGAYSVVFRGSYRGRKRCCHRHEGKDSFMKEVNTLDIYISS